jgi:NAD(P)H-dependent FMN reductase
MTKENPILIYGSSRGDGHTRRAVQDIIEERNIPIVDLLDLDISYFDYEHANENDDFLPLMERIVNHNPIIIATPVYWYSMSATMKTFFDRWSDLITIRKDLGRALENKFMYVITSYGTDFPIGFEDPIRLTCTYMKMQFGSTYFHYSGNDKASLAENERFAASFRQLLFPES